MQEEVTPPFPSSAFCTSMQTQYEYSKEINTTTYKKGHASSPFSSTLGITYDVTEIFVTSLTEREDYGRNLDCEDSLQTERQSSFRLFFFHKRNGGCFLVCFLFGIFF